MSFYCAIWLPIVSDCTWLSRTKIFVPLVLKMLVNLLLATFLMHRKEEERKSKNFITESSVQKVFICKKKFGGVNNT